MRSKENRSGGKSFNTVSNSGLSQTNGEVNGIDPLVLIVGQDYETRLLLKTLLELWQYKTIESPTVGEAENIAGFFPPTLILLDTDISFDKTLDNIYLIRRNEMFAALPLIVISGYGQPQYRDLAITNGADGYFVKPLNFTRMERALEKITRNDAAAAQGDVI